MSIILSEVLFNQFFGNTFESYPNGGLRASHGFDKNTAYFCPLGGGDIREQLVTHKNHFVFSDTEFAACVLDKCGRGFMRVVFIFGLQFFGYGSDSLFGIVGNNTNAYSIFRQRGNPIFNFVGNDHTAVRNKRVVKIRKQSPDSERRKKFGSYLFETRNVYVGSEIHFYLKKKTKVATEITTFKILLIFAFSGSLGLLLSFYGRLFIVFASLDLGKNTGSRALLLKTTKSIVQRLILFKFYFCHIRLPSLHRSENRNDFAHYKKKMYTILAKPLYTKIRGLSIGKQENMRHFF